MRWEDSLKIVRNGRDRDSSITEEICEEAKASPR